MNRFQLVAVVGVIAFYVSSAVAAGFSTTTTIRGYSGVPAFLPSLIQNDFVASITLSGASSHLINFESLPDGTPVISTVDLTSDLTYSNNLPVSVTLANETGIRIATDPGVPASSNHVLSPLDPDSGGKVLAVSFDQPVAAAGLWLVQIDDYNVGKEDARITWHFVDNSSKTVTFDTGSLHVFTADAFFGMQTLDSSNPGLAVNGITGFTAEQLGGNATYTDNLFIGYVPEPSSFVLAALGLMGLVVWRRRKR